MLPVAPVMTTRMHAERCAGIVPTNRTAEGPAATTFWGDIESELARHRGVAVALCRVALERQTNWLCRAVLLCLDAVPAERLHRWIVQKCARGSLLSCSAAHLDK